MMSRAWLVFGLLAGCFSNAPQVGPTSSDGSGSSGGSSGGSGSGTGESSTGTGTATSDSGADSSSGGPMLPQVGTILMKANAEAQTKSSWAAAFGGPLEGCEIVSGEEPCTVFECGPMLPVVPDAGAIQYSLNGTWQPGPLTPDAGGHYPLESLEVLPFTDGDSSVGFRAPGDEVPEFMVELQPPPALDVEQSGSEIATGAPTGFQLTWTTSPGPTVTAVLRLRQQGTMVFCPVPGDSGALTLTPLHYAMLDSGSVSYELTIEREAPVTAGGWDITAVLALTARNLEGQPVAGMFTLP
ncbi:MAG: hypothetical protein U0168_19730 [Nannocystaceae bacterium]